MNKISVQAETLGVDGDFRSPILKRDKRKRRARSVNQTIYAKELPKFQIISTFFNTFVWIRKKKVLMGSGGGGYFKKL